MPGQSLSPFFAAVRLELREEHAAQIEGFIRAGYEMLGEEGRNLLPIIKLIDTKTKFKRQKVEQSASRKFIKGYLYKEYLKGGLKRHRQDRFIIQFVTKGELRESIGLGELIGQTVEGPLAAGGAAVVAETISQKIAAWIKIHWKEVARTAILLTIFGFTWSTMNIPREWEGIHSTLIPEIVVGGVPLFSMQSLERGMSDRIVKYRAIGDVFLAHQRGTKDSLRVDGSLMGPYRQMWLMYLLRLQNVGEGELAELANMPEGKIHTTPTQADSVRIEKGKPVMYEHHKTFPIITHTAIMLDMFLQTIEWHTSIEDGMNIIKYHLLFRKHVQPLGYKAFDKKRAALIYGDTWTERIRKEAFYDTIWKLQKMGGELYRGSFFDGQNESQLNWEAVTSIPYGVFTVKVIQGANWSRLGSTTPF